MTGSDGGVANDRRGSKAHAATCIVTHRRNGADFEAAGRTAALLRE
jgi:hypothetical protein